MIDDEMSDLEGDDNQCDILPPAKKYKQVKLLFFVSGNDDHHEGDEEFSATGSTTAAAHGHGRVRADQHVTTVWIMHLRLLCWRLDTISTNRPRHA